MNSSVVPFVDLRSQYRSIKDEILTAVSGVLESAQYTLGPEVAAFERAFAAYSGGMKHGIAVNSGTSALHLALLAAGVGPGDEVITVPFTFVASVAAIDYTSARAVFVDVNEDSKTMEPEQFERAITPRTKAVLPVHLHGGPADMAPILEIAQKHNLIVIEDAAQAHGAEYNGRRCGAMGHMACFSFYPAKNLGACGEGGIILTNDDEYSRRLQMMRDWGQEKKYHHVMPGFNYRMSALQGAVLKIKLLYLEEWTEARRAHARRYTEIFSSAEILHPIEMSGTRHVWHVYAIRTPERQVMQERLRDVGVQTAIHYPIPVHLQPAFSHLGYEQGDFPVSEKLAHTVLSLPMYPEMTEENIHTVASNLVRFSQRRT